MPQWIHMIHVPDSVEYMLIDYAPMSHTVNHMCPTLKTRVFRKRGPFDQWSNSHLTTGQMGVPEKRVRPGRGRGWTWAGQRPGPGPRGSQATPDASRSF